MRTSAPPQASKSQQQPARNGGPRARPTRSRAAPPSGEMGEQGPHTRGKLLQSSFMVPVLALRLQAHAAHQAEHLVSVAQAALYCWAQGAKAGPSDEVLGDLYSLVGRNVTIRSAHLLGQSCFQGLDGLRDKLTLDHHREGIARPVRSIVCAANEERGSVFCLLQCQGEAAEAEKGTGVERMDHRTHGLVKFDTVCKGADCRITGVTERWQLGPTDAALLALHSASAAAAAAPHAKPQAAALKAALELADSSHFPSARIQEMEYDAHAALRSMELWCRARCSGEDEQQLLKQALVKYDFRLWDAYGVLPLLCGVERERHSCVLDQEQVVDMARKLKARYHLLVTLVDRAVCPRHNVGFAHWRAYFRPLADAGMGSHAEQWTQDALELHVFDEEGRIMDTWMLRDPAQEEGAMLEAVARAPVAAVV